MALTRTKMLQVALYEPEIPPNTGNIARLCAATFTDLHIVGVTGFLMDDRELKRSGLDYWNEVKLHRHIDIEELFAIEGEPEDVTGLRAEVDISVRIDGGGRPDFATALVALYQTALVHIDNVHEAVVIPEVGEPRRRNGR